MRLLTRKQAPKFGATAVINGHEIVQDLSLDQYRGRKYVVFFFYPMDFTFMCPTELHTFQGKLDGFEKQNTTVVGCLVDPEYSHFSWLQVPKSEGGTQGVKYPIVPGFSKSISESYGVLIGNYTPDENDNWVCERAPVAFHGLFLIDKKDVVRHCVINDLPLERSIDEVLRMVGILQHFEEYDEVYPANWSRGRDVMRATGGGVTDYLSKR